VAVLGTAAGFVAGLFGLRWIVLVAVVAAALAEPLVRPGGKAMESLLGRASLDQGARTVLRFFAVLATGFTLWSTSGMLAAFGWTAGGYLLASGAMSLLLYYVDHERTPVVLMRNVDLRPPDIRPAPPAGLRYRSAGYVRLLELTIIVPALLAPGRPEILWLVGGTVVVLLLLLDGRLVLAARAAAGKLRGAALRRRVQKYLDRYRPEVLVYFGGRRESAYQLTMWLETVEALPHRSLLLLREPKVLEDLPATSVPVLCVPGSVDLMSLDLSASHVALFAANVGNSLHILRLPHLMTVFIGHGDSDKSASSSPFAKVYDEVWVAGPAGRERYRRAQVGVRDDDIIEVGRPQLDEIIGLPATTGASVPTLLYAPTWEGWNEEQQYTSVVTMGPELVAAALAAPEAIRVVYKPHPFTGRRDPGMARAHQRIVDMLAAANVASSGQPVQAPLSLPTVVAATDDGLEGAFSTSPHAATEVAALRRDAERDYWAARDATSHLVVEADGPSLFSCFGQADALITDISSVLTDFAATGRPYAVTNPTEIPAAEFTTMFPATAGGYLVAPGAGAAAFLDIVGGRAPDGLVGRRAELRTELLGTATGPATPRFAAAVDALVARGRAREAAHLRRGALRPGTRSGAPPDTGEMADE
jgi:hypothetical protein